MITVLLTAAAVPAGGLDVAVRVRADPYRGPGGRDRQPANALQRIEITDQCAVWKAVVEPVSCLVPAYPRHIVADVTQLGELCRRYRIACRLEDSCRIISLCERLVIVSLVPGSQRGSRAKTMGRIGPCQHRARRGVPGWGERRGSGSPAASSQVTVEAADRSPNSASEKRCWLPAASNIRSRQRRSMPSLVICTPSTGCSSSSASEYSFAPLDIASSCLSTSGNSRWK